MCTVSLHTRACEVGITTELLGNVSEIFKQNMKYEKCESRYLASVHKSQLQYI